VRIYSVFKIQIHLFKNIINFMSYGQNRQKLFFSILLFTAFLPVPAKAAELVFLGRPVVDIVNDIILFLLSIIGGIALLMFVLGGTFYIFAGSNPEAQNKAKQTVTKAIIGLTLVLISYGIINKTSEISTDIMVASLPTCYWECSEWSNCVAGNQTRVCVESCGAVVGGPIITRPCVAPPASFDWSHKILPAALPAGGANWMTNVKDQGGCGSCWAFATLGYMEAMYNIENSNAALDKNLSEQDLVSCSSGSCSGGSLPGTAEYIQDTGVVAQSCFAYSASNEACSVPNKCAAWATELWKITTWSLSTSSNQQSIKNELVNGGPVLATMNMSTWNSATESCASSTENHAVVIVGYDDIGGYWIVKNSYGVGWIDGIAGYFKVKYGQCGLDSGMTVAVENVMSP
jgi:hypothetical protein